MTGEPSLTVRKLTWLVVAVFAGALFRPISAPADEERLPVLRRINVIAGAESGYVRVRVPTNSELDLSSEVASLGGPNENISISGGGRFIGIALVQEDSSGAWTGNVRLAGTLNRCSRPGCVSKTPLQLATGSSRLPKGVYRLYLIADGAPVTVKFSLDGPTGETTLRPDQHARTTIGSPRPAFLADAVGYFSGGRTYEVRSRSLMLSAMWTTTARTGGVYSACMYRGRATKGAAGGFSPLRCLQDNYQGDQPDYFLPAPLPAGTDLTYLLYETDPSVPKGEWSKGYWWMSPTPVTDAGITTLFLSRD